MTERPALGDPPVKSPLSGEDNKASLQWLAWFTGLIKWVQRTRVFVFSVDVPSIPGGSTWTNDYTIANAVPGDFAVATLDPTNPGLFPWAQVTAANTVRVTVTNTTGGAIDLAAGSIWIRVERAR